MSISLPPQSPLGSSDQVDSQGRFPELSLQEAKWLEDFFAKNDVLPSMQQVIERALESMKHALQDEAIICKEEVASKQVQQEEVFKQNLIQVIHGLKDSPEKRRLEKVLLHPLSYPYTGVDSIDSMS